MTILKGKELREITVGMFREIAGAYESVHVDIGTGDGSYVYKHAKNNPTCLFVGIDPVTDNMLEISRKLMKKPAKGGLPNVLLVRASAEDLPPELESAADAVTVNFPWGSLLEGCVRGEPEIISGILFPTKPTARITIRLTYSDQYEEGTILRRNLPALTVGHFEDLYAKLASAYRFTLLSVTKTASPDFKTFASEWGKRLAFGRSRDVFELAFVRS